MKPCFTLSATLVVVSLVLMLIHGGPRLSIDFTGGSVVQVKFAASPGISQVRADLEAKGYAGVQVTEFGAANEYLITVAAAKTATGGEAADTAQKLLDDLRTSFPASGVELRRVESVGPKIGGELRTAAINSIIAGLFLIIIYIWLRFVLRYGFAAIAALVHDVTLTLGIFSLLDLEISLQIVAALLTIVGYSINDTIVVFDRIRENMKLRRKESYREVINRSINETLSRTILTSATTMVVSVMLWTMGGPVIRDFAFALSFGIFVGTYSSIFIASPLLVWWYERRAVDSKRAAPTM
ncbi:protein translocase subunit SecF [bacterium]|nr:protein translocase subunit SecF [bacterium]